MTRRQTISLLGLAALLGASPYSVGLGGGAAIQETTACAQTGFCVEAGCKGGRDYCYQPPSGGMCYTTAPPQET